MLCLVTTRGAPQPTESELKAVLLFHLTQFTTWPATNTAHEGEFVIGILGPDPFSGALAAVTKGEKVNGHPIHIERSNRARNLTHCALVYVSPQFRDSVPRALNELRQGTILTVGETDQFIEAGGMVRLKKTEDQKIRLQVHLSRVRASGLNISAQLLRVSEVLENDRK